MSGPQKPWVHCAHQVAGACSECFPAVAGAVDALRAEVERLRAELEKVVRNADRPGDQFSIASAALDDGERLREERDEAYDREARAFDALAKEQIRAGRAEAEVERLRAYVAKLESEPSPAEALAEVERLKAALRDMREHHCSCDFKEMDEDCWTCNRAREALGEVES